MKTFFDIPLMKIFHTEVPGVPSPQCLVSDEWVDWFVDNTGVTEKEARQVGGHWFLSGMNTFNQCLNERYLADKGFSCEQAMLSAPHKAATEQILSNSGKVGKDELKRHKSRIEAFINATLEGQDKVDPLVYNLAKAKFISEVESPTGGKSRGTPIRDAGESEHSDSKGRREAQLRGIDTLFGGFEGRSVPIEITEEHVIKLPTAIQKVLAFMAEKRDDDLAEVLFHSFDPTNVWKKDQYVNRTQVGTSIGVESSLSFQYVRGSAFVNGWIDETAIRIYYSNLQGFQVHHAPLGAGSLEGDDISPSIFRPEDMIGVYEFIASVVKNDSKQ